MQWFFLLFPFLELWTLIEVGAAYGGLAAIGWVILTVALGLGMIRRQGLSMIRQVQRDAEDGLVISPRLLGDDLAVVTSGLLLVVPGLITDCLAIIVLVGPLRRRLMSLVPARYRTGESVTVTRRYTTDGGTTFSETRSYGKPDGGDGNVTLEGDFSRVDDPDSPPSRD